MVSKTHIIVAPCIIAVIAIGAVITYIFRDALTQKIIPAQNFIVHGVLAVSYYFLGF